MKTSKDWSSTGLELISSRHSIKEFLIESMFWFIDPKLDLNKRISVVAWKQLHSDWIPWTFFTAYFTNSSFISATDGAATLCPSMIRTQDRVTPDWDLWRTLYRLSNRFAAAYLGLWQLAQLPLNLLVVGSIPVSTIFSQELSTLNWSVRPWLWHSCKCRCNLPQRSWAHCLKPSKTPV